MTTIYSARWVLPIASPAIDFGAIAIEGGKIIAVGEERDISSRFPHATVKYFRDCVLLPGFVNAHSHLELTVMRGFLEREEHDFFAWLRKLTIARMALTENDLLVSAMCGAVEAARTGITCVGDSSSSALETMRAVAQVGLRGIIYQESFGPDRNLAEVNVAKLESQLEQMREVQSDIVIPGVSPHAPYTVSAKQIEMIARLAIEEQIPLMMHAAESEAETSFVMHGTGPFADGLRNRGIDWEATGVSTIQYLARHGLLETKPLLAHCITIDDDDIKTIRRAGAAIAHCPKSNAKLRHGCAPFEKFIDANLKVGLGSDSVASNNNSDILEEARFATLVARLAKARPGRDARDTRANHDRKKSKAALSHGGTSDTVTAGQALFAATLGGARALGLDGQVGALAEGMHADFILVAMDGAHQQPVSDPADALIFCSSGRDVRLTVVAGKEIYRDNHIATTNEAEVVAKLSDVRRKLEAATAVSGRQ